MSLIFNKLYILEFRLDIRPKPQQRHKDGRGYHYDPSAALKQNFLALAYEHRPKEPITDPTALEIEFCFPRPKKHYNKKGLKPDAPLFYAIRPDLDNIEKLVMDALNKVFYRDDCLICRKETTKIYGETPYIWVRLSYLTMPKSDQQ